MRAASVNRYRHRILAALVGCALVFAGTTPGAPPHIGYVYPAGGQAGTTIEVSVGGQALKGAKAVHVTGEGVTGTVTTYLRRLNNDQLNVIKKHINLARKAIRDRAKAEAEAAKKAAEEKAKAEAAKKAAEEKAKAEAAKKAAEEKAKAEAAKKAAEEKAKAEAEAAKKAAEEEPAKAKAASSEEETNPADAEKKEEAEAKAEAEKKKKEAEAKAKAEAEKKKKEEIPLPEHPVLKNLDQMNMAELQYAWDYFFSPKRQRNAQIDELAVVQLTIAPDAAPGQREIRLVTAGGLTNPMYFEVGSLAEAVEHEPNDPPDVATPEGTTILEPPLALNGQILPGDVDRFWFRARRGQQLVCDTTARVLNPYLADAVPGWFQAVLAVYDANGTELAFQDDYRFYPDPVLCFEVPADGVYALEIRDAIYRGREDFVYRIALGDQPFITEAFPLGAKVGSEARVAVDGWNLPAFTYALDTAAGDRPIREAELAGATAGNRVPYAVDDLPEHTEAEPNNTPAHAQAVSGPAIVNGRIDQPGDTDVYRIEGKAGETVVAEVLARRLESPVDSVVYIEDAAGKTLAWNDDPEVKNTGILTHHADSYASVKLPADGAYFVRIADAQNGGGRSYAYRLRIGPLRPDFDLYVLPSSLTIGAGNSQPVTMHVIRRDGYNGPIDVVLAGESGGFTLGGGRIPAGHDQVRATLTAPSKTTPGPVALRLQGQAAVGERKILRRAVPADDVMQAFLYRHYLPARELVAVVQGAKWAGPQVAMAAGGVVRIPAAGSVEVQLKAPDGTLPPHMHVGLQNPPKGVDLRQEQRGPDTLVLVLSADGKDAAPGLANNLFLTASKGIEEPKEEGSDEKKIRRVPLGMLPAVPIEVVAP